MAKRPYNPNQNPRVAGNRRRRNNQQGNRQQNQRSQNMYVTNDPPPNIPQQSATPTGSSYRLQDDLKVEGDTGHLIRSLRKGSKVTRVTPLKNKKFGIEVEVFDREGLPHKQYADVTSETLKTLEGLSDAGFDPSVHSAAPKLGFVDSFKAGYEWQGQRPKEGPGIFSDKNSSRYSTSFVTDVATNRHPPKAFYEGTNNAAVNLGRFVGDVTGFGTQHFAWNVHPLDLLSTVSYNKIKQAGGSAELGRMTAWGAASILGAASGNWNPLNLSEGGRQKGFRAISQDEEDATKSTNPVMDTVFHRGILGRTGWLLPWEEFKTDRPDVSYEQYEGYKDYLRDGGFMGLLKATPHGIDGPEARLMGYRVTVPGALAAGATLAGGIALAKNQAKKNAALPHRRPSFARTR